MASTGAPITPADRLSFTVFIAAALHASLIFGLGFNPQAPSSPPRTIEVTIAHQLSDTEPEDADFLAQSNQEGSGDENEKRELTTTEMAPFDNANVEHVQLQAPSTIAPNPEMTQRLTLTTQGVSKRKTPAKQEKKKKPIPLPKSKVESQELLSKKIASLQARLDEQKQAYAKRPRVRTLTSVSAKAHYEALYIDAFRREVEAIGTRNFPSQALSENKFGNVRLLVKLVPSGSVKAIDVLKSSGHPFLDEAAIKSVRLASPFAPFTAEMKQNIDILEIIRTWKFDPKQTLTSR